MNAAKMMTGPEVMEVLGISHMSLYNWRGNGTITAHQIDQTRNVYYDPKEVLTVAKSRGTALTMTKLREIMAARKPNKPGPKPKAKPAARSKKTH